ncbi:MAG: shikimate dehydrogenase [Betaproteobacteria bacterium]|nr:shikimate dehydrogenase [Betaproteobacteria bacterium]MDE2621747.1 shikimate dehydrogenase [Betaproteobacteria bacterium]
MDRYAVMGYPVAHSLSPQIHALFAKATGQPMVYERIGPHPEAFEEAVAQFRSQGGKGLNITLPFKERAYALADRRSARAQAAGAANTLDFRAGDIYADNTDGVGLVRDLERNLGCKLLGRSVLLLGAGGAARGVVEPLLAAGVTRLVVANRTPSRAEILLDQLRHSGGIAPDRMSHCMACGLDGIPQGSYHFIINATSGSLSGEVPALPGWVFGPQALAYDMVYGKGSTPFMTLARDQGVARSVDGLGMLVEQAAESFHLWRGVYPETAPVLQLLRAELG